VVAEADYYPARFEQVKKLVLDVTDMFIISEKTSNSSLFSELGVQDPTAENSRSHLITFKDGAGNIITSLVAGRTSESGASVDNPGQYVRNPVSNDTFLVSRALDLSTDATDWIERELLNIPDDRIMETTIAHADGATVTLVRKQGEANFAVTNLPEGKVSNSYYFTNQPGTFLSDLRIDNVKARSNFTFPEEQAKTTIRTYDGLVATITSANVDGLNYATIDFTVDDAMIEQSTPDSTSDAIVIGGPAPVEMNDVRQEATDLNNKVANWVFIISTPKYLLLTKRPEELTSDRPAEETK